MAGKLSKQIGAAKIIDEAAYSDGSTAQQIHNFRRNERNNLETKFLIIPAVHRGLVSGGIPVPFIASGGCLAACYTSTWGEVPELLFLTKTGVFRYEPWWPSLVNGLREQFHYHYSGSESVTPQGASYFPPQWAAVGNRIYFSWCDGGALWVWDAENERLRPFGYPARPSPPDAQGPAAGGNSGSQNSGGFSARGRIGTTDGTWTDEDGVTVGGVDDLERHYYVVYENVDGAYSAMSPRGGVVTMRAQLADPFAESFADRNQPEDLCKRMRVYGIPQGPVGTAATILLATSNLKRLPQGDHGEPRFLQRIPSAIVDQIIDDIPDGELGATWQEREVTPVGVHLLRAFSGSLFLARTNAYPARIWWSEQTSTAGPTPESILAGHWRDVEPATGPITALFGAQVGGGAVAAALLILKEDAAHFLTGNYPDWQIGTLHQRAGCAGPNVIASVPDGSVIWYGARTFWRLAPDGTVRDIGTAVIRKRLRRINYAEARNGSVLVDRHSGEVVFSLPVDDGITPSFQFIWDYIEQGWRTGDWMTITNTLEVPNEDLIFVVGTYDGETNVFAWGRGACNIKSAPNNHFYSGLNPATYQTGWNSFDSFPKHTFFNYEYVVGIGDELYDGALAMRMMRNWNASETPGFDVSDTDSASFTLAHPEQAGIAYWSSSVVGDRTVHPAVFGAVYRERRPYTVRVGAAAASAEVVGIELTVTPPSSFALVGLTAYGTKIADDGTRVGHVSEGQ
jgi:hypothetical protein